MVYLVKTVSMSVNVLYPSTSVYRLTFFQLPRSNVEQLLAVFTSSSLVLDWNVIYHYFRFFRSIRIQRLRCYEQQCLSQFRADQMWNLLNPSDVNFCPRSLAFSQRQVGNFQLDLTTIIIETFLKAVAFVALKTSVKKESLNVSSQVAKHSIKLHISMLNLIQFYGT